MGAAITTCHCSRDTRVTAVALQAPLYDFSFVVDYPEFTAMWEGLAMTGLVKFPKDGIKERLLEDIKGNCPLNCIKKISPRPILVVAGKKDTFMPLDGILRLYSNAYKPKKFEIIMEADHNLTNYLARYETFELLKEFFMKVFYNKQILTKSESEKISAV